MTTSTVRRARVYIDGQNLFHSAREIFGYGLPNYDVMALARAICAPRGWELAEVCFYTGVPGKDEDPRWHHFWERKLAVLGRQGVTLFTRRLRYRERRIAGANGEAKNVRVGEEKGIDVRIAIDSLRAAIRGSCEVIVYFSQDQDLAEAAKEVLKIGTELGKSLRVVSAFPIGDGARTRRGINNTEWIPIDKALYDKCLDHRRYRPKNRPSQASASPPRP